jgi:hypothetical protein
MLNPLAVYGAAPIVARYIALICDIHEALLEFSKTFA